MKLKPDAMLLLGDNFYGPFKGGTQCPRWKEQFEEMYPVSVCSGPCYAILGNHHRRDSSVMRPLRYSINGTLDGCCDHREMIADEDLHRYAIENLDQADALLFGRVTYEMMR